jgi:hypothetical protein
MFILYGESLMKYTGGIPMTSPPTATGELPQGGLEAARGLRGLAVHNMYT